jgi:hypothetical protein
MKRIIYLIGLLSLLVGSGCVIREEHHHRGGAYDPYYHGYGHGSYHPYDRDHYYRPYYSDPSLEFRYRQY